MSTTVAAAPLGARVGFTAAGDQTRQVGISVLPKVWRPDNRRLVVWPGWLRGNHQQVVLYETDRLHASGFPDGIDELLAKCLRASRGTVGESTSWESALLAPDVVPQDADLRNARTTDSIGTDASTDLLLLFDQLDLLSPQIEHLFGGPAHSPIHRPLLYRRLLDEILALANSARRGYRSVTTNGGTIRGRIHPSSAIRYSFTSDPRLVCTYNELTESTVLLGVVCAALEQVAGAVGLQSPFSGKYSNTRLIEDAVRLRRIFSEVAALPNTKARLEGQRLRLSRLDQPWGKALQLSLALLETREFGAMYARSRLADAVELSVPTEKLWERIVSESLRRAGFHRVLKPATQPPGATSDPWISSPSTGSRSQPDNLAWLGDQLWVIDAKYKTPPGASPARDDQYQLFAYSHLVELEQDLTQRVALIYPGHGAPRVWRRGRTALDRPCFLFSLQIPFPEPLDVRGPTAWQHYLDHAGTTLRSSLEEASLMAGIGPGKDEAQAN